MTVDWAKIDTGQGFFRCGAETHKNKQYQSLITCSFYRSLLDFVEDTSVQNNLRAVVARILSLTLQKNEVKNDVESDPNMRDETVLVL